MENQYDVVIVGGGMVGATLACALGGSSLRVAVVEGEFPAEFAPEQPRDIRVSAVSIASVSIFDTLGAWRGMTTRRCCPFRRMRVWEGQGDVEFNCRDINESVLGYIVENRVIQLALLERVRDFDNIRLWCPANTRAIDYSPDTSTVTLEDGTALTTRLLVAADGGFSRVRQAAGMGVSHQDYEQQALVLTVETGYGQQDITWQRFVPTGPQAFLPLTGNYASLVWYHTPENVKRLRACTDAELLGELTREFPLCLGDVRRIVARGSFPLRRQHALCYAKDGVALIGDAAHMIHPLAGQGVNIGLLDAAALAEVIVTAATRNEDFGAAETLKRYERMRRTDNLVMMSAMDLFYRLFGNANVPLKFLRNLGLGLAERIVPAKNFFMRQAMGIQGKLPKLARGEALDG
ncbi:MAG: UbiH/UbiF/VisC/COQ6 family ubiquinone biosynthesis hydroxylase [Methylotetracoccus sp.]|nr:UbiH/UbiF/VisC/COQ6 family ubiquinone biosynthesis hydroxylase [Methylotetracoccus sp.]